MSRASTGLSGGRPRARSASTSTAVPPWPNRTTGPKTSSTITPAISSWAPARITMGSREKPSIRASGFLTAIVASMAVAAAATSAWPLRPRATPPTSDLWLMSGDRIFKASNPPMSAAIAPASAGVRAMRVVTVGTP